MQRPPVNVPNTKIAVRVTKSSSLPVAFGRMYACQSDTVNTQTCSKAAHTLPKRLAWLLLQIDVVVEACLRLKRIRSST